jgi:hypothetical protein
MGSWQLTVSSERDEATRDTDKHPAQQQEAINSNLKSGRIKLIFRKYVGFSSHTACWWILTIFNAPYYPIFTLYGKTLTRVDRYEGPFAYHCGGGHPALFKRFGAPSDAATGGQGGQPEQVRDQWHYRIARAPEKWT